MKMKYMSLLCAGVLSVLAACDQQADEAQAPAQPVPKSAAAPEPVHVSEWLGRWNGPEGTYLDIAEREIGYIVTIADLDGPRAFDGTGTEDGIVFTRDGEVLTIHAGTGEETGMKWLSGKRHCLVVKTGEGYCRD